MVMQALSAHNRRRMSTPSTTPVDWQTPFEIILLGAIWGASFLFQRVAAPEMGALPLAAVQRRAGPADPYAGVPASGRGVVISCAGTVPTNGPGCIGAADQRGGGVALGSFVR